MIFNYFEESRIRLNDLPTLLQNKDELILFKKFLQENWDNRKVFYDDNSSKSEQQFFTFFQNALNANNYIGSIVYKGVSINVFPKMFKTAKFDINKKELSVDHLLFNIGVWLSYSDKNSFPNIPIKSNISANNLKELLYSIFIFHLESALNKYYYHQYEEQEEDLNNIKGRINFNNYLVRKIPVADYAHFSCKYSEFVFDNKLNQIIKYVCKLIFNDCNNLQQKKLRIILSKLLEISDYKFTASDCNLIKISPMHKQYKIILNFCRLFLLNKNSTYNVENFESYCFLFPTELLYEGFVGGFIKEEYTDRSVYLQRSDTYLFDDILYDDQSFGPTIKPRKDIVVNYNNKEYIMDTKYKQIRRFQDDDVRAIIGDDVKESDIYQVCTYAVSRGVNKAYLLYPMYRYEEIEENFVKAKKEINYEGLCYNIEIIFARVPFVFEKDFAIEKEKLKKSIDKLFEM